MSCTNESIKEAVLRLKTEARAVWAMLIEREGSDVIDTPMDLIADISNDVRDLLNSIDHPKLSRQNCYNVEGVIHASSYEENVYLPLGKAPPRIVCGLQIPLDARVVPLKSIPTCPDCIATLELSLKP